MGLHLLCNLGCQMYLLLVSQTSCCHVAYLLYHIILSMLNNSISDIPNSARPSLGTIKNLHLTHLSSCLFFTIHTPSCSMFDWLYVCNIMLLFLVVCNSGIVDFGNRLFNMLDGIKLPPVLVSLLYIIWVLFWLVFNSSSVIVLISCCQNLSI